MKIAAALALAAFAAAASTPLLEGEMDWTGVLDEESFASLHDLTENEAPELAGDDVEVGDMDAYLSLPEVGDPVAAVIVIHEWWGLNDHVKHWADRLASDGYAALAVDLYGGTVATTRDEAMTAMRAVDEEAALASLAAAHEYLTDGDGPVGAERTACIGWCFGGGWSLKLAMAEPKLDAAVVYYGRLTNDVEALSKIEAPMLGVFGNEDRGIPPKAVNEFAEAMDEAGCDLTLARYDAEHAFANPSSARYDAEHAADAWNRTREFLCEHLWPESPDGMLGDRSRELEMWLPDGWSSEEGSGMRLATVKIGAESECSLITLRGDGGGLVPNVNRWRGQMGQDDLSEDEVEALPRVPMFGRLVPVVRIEGDSKPMRGNQITDALMLAAICELDGETLFVKLVGPRAELEVEEHAFAAFCRGLR